MDTKTVISTDSTLNYGAQPRLSTSLVAHRQLILIPIQIILLPTFSIG